MAQRKGNRLLLVLGLIGIALFLWFAVQDPSLRDGGELEREQVLAKAEAFWLEKNVDVSGYEVNSTLETAKEAEGYIAKNDLRGSFAEKAPADAALIFWNVTYHDRELDDTYHTRLDPVSGRVIGFDMNILSDADTLDPERGEALALGELRKRGFTPDELQREETLEGDLYGLPLEENFDAEWTYFYRVDNWKLQDLAYRYKVTVTGDQVSAVETEFIVPQEFLSWHQTQQTIGLLLTGLSLLLTFLLFVLSMVFLFLIKQKKPFWSSLWLSLLIFGLFLFSNLNQLPMIEQQMLGEAGGFGAMFGVVFMVVMVVILSLIVGAATYPMLLTGGMLVREVNPRLWTSWRDPDWSERLRRAMWQGYLLAFAWLGFQGLFYWMGEEFFGVWYESDTSLSPVNMWIPLLFPLLAWLAGIQEEVVYRLFGVTFFKKYAKSAFLAALIPAMIWALGHSLYPVYPIYTRFIELTIFGLIIGYCYLWFGLEAVIFAHVTFDAIQMGIPLLLSGDPAQIISAVVFLLLPILVAYGLSLFRPRPKPEPGGYEIV